MSFFTTPPPRPLPTEPSTFRTRAINLFEYICTTLLTELESFFTTVQGYAAAMNTNDTRDTSLSSVLIGTGSKTFTVSAGKSFSGGQWLTIADTAAPSTNSMVGQVTSYSGTTLIVNVPSNGIFGSGTKSSWVIALTAAPSTDISAAMKPVTSATTLKSAGDGLGVVAHNLLINSANRINQMAYVSGATLAAGVYGHDMWKAGASGGNYTFTQAASGATLTIAAGKSLIQVIEPSNVEGSTYTLSWTGTAVARVGVNTATPSGVFAVSPITVSAQTAGTVMSVEFAGAGAVGTSAVSSGTAGTVVDAQLVAGSVATAALKRHISVESELCKWYYRIIPAATANFAGYCFSTNRVLTNLQTGPMRAAPTASTGAVTVFYNGTATNSSANTINTTKEGAVSFDLTVTATANTSNVCSLTAPLILDSRL